MCEDYMFYTRGSSDDWDEFARISGDDGWSWRKIYPYFLKSEALTAPADKHNTTGQINPKVHGTKGSLLTSLPAMGLPIDSSVLNTTVQLKSEFPFNVDMNSGTPLGVGTLQSTIGNGTRSSTATAFLVPILSQRSNLDVLMNTHVTKLVRTGRKDTTPIFRQVRFSQTSQGQSFLLTPNPLSTSSPGPTFTVTALKEVLLAAGSVGTPQLLMLSGIGDSPSLQKLGIKTVLSLPDVGKNALDHPFVALQWSVNSNNTYDLLNQSPEALQAATAEYNATHQGPLANNPGANNIGFFRLPEVSDVLKGIKDPAPGPKSPHFELTFGNSFLSFTQAPPSSGSYFSMLVAMTSPKSRGTLELASTDPFVQPLINPNMLTESIDLLVLTEAVKAAQRFSQAPAWKGYINAPYVDSANLTSDVAIKAYIRNFASSFNHIAGTATISKARDPCGVVGPDLKVKGAEGLRVVDASVLAIVCAIAERASDLVKASA
ncbi:hypothetical protein DXG01_007319 [Tephrocybe rancida]|nr:hypothetical protein DXG01_007319 [Tephrocybe rancida]